MGACVRAFEEPILRANDLFPGLTRGLIVNEIIRRVDPRSRTIGVFVKEEISAPLGIDFYIGGVVYTLFFINYYSHYSHPKPFSHMHAWTQTLKYPVAIKFYTQLVK